MLIKLVLLKVKKHKGVEKHAIICLRGLTVQIIAQCSDQDHSMEDHITILRS